MTTQGKTGQSDRDRDQQPELEIRGNEAHMTFDTRNYRIRGLENNYSPQQLKVNILARRDELVHLDTLDLYKARSRNTFIKATATELFTDSKIIKRDIGAMLLRLEQLQHDQIEEATQSQQIVEISAADKRAALKLLKDPQLIELIVQDFDACGLAGEETNKLVCYLPTSVLSIEQVESLLNQPDITTALGIRDRAIMETFYSSGIRCGELVGLDVYDISLERQVLTVRRGKGNKDRVVPIGTRALSWVSKWSDDVRPVLVTRTSAEALFVSKNGRRLCPNYVSNLVRRYLTRIGIEYRGSCHLLRHTAATLMMENGADLRSLQEFLGHSRLNTTQIYTRVSIQRLQEVHRKTHPAKPNSVPGENLPDEAV